MATTTTKARISNQNLSRSKSLTTQREKKAKPEANGVVGDPSGSTDQKDDQKPAEKPIPNYLKPTISSRPDPVKFLRKNNSSLEDTQKLLRRRSFDRPPSSLNSPPSSTASRGVQKSLNISPGRPRDRPLVPREKVATTSRSSSFHTNRSSTNASKPHPRAAAGKSPVASGCGTMTKKSSLSSTSNSKKEAASGASKKVADINVVETVNVIEGTQESPSAVDEVEQDFVKVGTEIQVSDEAARSEDKEVEVEAVKPEAEEEKETNQTDHTSPVSDGPNVSKAEELIIEDPKSGEEKIEEKDEEKTEEVLENREQEAKESEQAPESSEEKAEGENEAKIEVEDQKDQENTNTDPTDLKVATTIEDTEDDEKAADHEGKDKDGNVEEGSTEVVNKPKAAESPEGSKRQVVQGKKESPSAYNAVIEETASKLLEKRKNKVKALVGAFETVIDYETASSK